MKTPRPRRPRQPSPAPSGSVTMNIGQVTGTVIGQQVLPGGQHLTHGSTDQHPPTPAPRPSAASPPRPAEGLAFILSADLEGFSQREQAWKTTLPGQSTAGVQALRDWIEQTVRDCCRQAGHDLVWYQDQGDAWFFPVPKAGTAHRIAEALHDAAAAESAASGLQPPLRFRIGIARSNVSYTRPPPSGFDAASGSTAARLRAQSEPGGTLICPHTWAALPAKARKWYDPQQVTFPDKHGETFAGHRWRKGPSTTVRPPFSVTASPVPDNIVSAPPSPPASSTPPPAGTVGKGFIAHTVHTSTIEIH